MMLPSCGVLLHSLNSAQHAKWTGSVAKSMPVTWLEFCKLLHIVEDPAIVQVEQWARQLRSISQRQS